MKVYEAMKTHIDDVKEGLYFFAILPLPSVSIFTMVIPFLLWYTICDAFRAYI